MVVDAKLQVKRDDSMVTGGGPGFVRVPRTSPLGAIPRVREISVIGVERGPVVSAAALNRWWSSAPRFGGDDGGDIEPLHAQTHPVA